MAEIHVVEALAEDGEAFASFATPDRAEAHKMRELCEGRCDYRLSTVGTDDDARGEFIAEVTRQ